MSNDSELEAILTAITMNLAVDLVDTLDLASMIGDEQAIGERLVRRMRRAAMLNEIAALVWGEHARELLVSTLTENGVEESSIDLELAEKTFVAFFVTSARGKLDETSGVLERLEFEQSGPSAAGGPSNGTGNVHNYVLARDGDSVVYVSGEEMDDFGVSWRLGESGWEAGNRIPLTFEYTPEQVFNGFYDPVREGVACWTLTTEPGADESIARGVLVDASGANPIEQSGDVPTGPFSTHFDFGVIFGRDPERKVTVALGRECVWELGEDNAWKRVCDIPEARRPKKTWFSGTSGSVFSPGHGVIFFWKDWDDSELCMSSWNGKHVLPVAKTGLDDRAYIYDSSSFVEHPEHGAVMLSTAGTLARMLFAYDGREWARVGRLDPELPPVEFASAVCDGERWIIGPGKRDTPGGSVDEEALHLVAGDSVTRFGDAPVGTGTASARRLLATGGSARVLHGDGRLAVHSDDGWEDAGASLDADIVALVPGNKDDLFGIARDGAVHVYRGGTWTQLGHSSPVFDGVRARVYCFDAAGDRLVAWGGRRGDDGSDGTDVFPVDSGAWTALAGAGTPIRAQSNRWRNGGDEERDLGCHLVYDSVLRQPLLFHRDEVAALQGERWAVVSPRNFDSLVEDDHRLIIHDAGTEQTLAVCLTKERVIRFDVDECTLVCDVSVPGGAELGRRSLDRPWQADWVYERDAGRLVLFYDDELVGVLSLDLRAAFEHASSKGERTALRTSQAHRLDSEPSVVAAVTAAALHTAETLTDEQIEASLTLSLRNSTRSMIRDGAVRLWRSVGADAIARACAEAGVDLEALGFIAEDCREMFADALAANLSNR
jgi:hypothetical protein